MKMKFPWILFFNVVLLILDFTYLYMQTIKYIPASFDYIPKEILRMKMHPSLKKRRVHEYGKIMSDFK